jgi:hypothetical protein
MTLVSRKTLLRIATHSSVSSIHGVTSNSLPIASSVEEFPKPP